MSDFSNFLECAYKNAVFCQYASYQTNYETGIDRKWPGWDDIHRRRWYILTGPRRWDIWARGTYETPWIANVGRLLRSSVVHNGLGRIPSRHRRPSLLLSSRNISKGEWSRENRKGRCFLVYRLAESSRPPLGKTSEIDANSWKFWFFFLRVLLLIFQFYFSWKWRILLVDSFDCSDYCIFRNK